MGAFLFGGYAMRKRSIAILFRLNEAEHQYLKEQVALSGYTTEQFIRNLIAGVEMHPRPPDEMVDILRQLSAIGNNINQIARATNARGFVRQEELERISAMQSEIWRMIKRL